MAATPQGERLREALDSWGKGVMIFESLMKHRGVTGASYPAIKRYLDGPTEPPIAFLTAAASELGVEPAWLILGPPHPRSARAHLAPPVAPTNELVDADAQADTAAGGVLRRQETSSEFRKWAYLPKAALELLPLSRAEIGRLLEADTAVTIALMEAINRIGPVHRDAANEHAIDELESDLPIPADLAEWVPDIRAARSLGLMLGAASRTPAFAGQFTRGLGEGPTSAEFRDYIMTICQGAHRLADARQRALRRRTAQTNESPAARPGGPAADSTPPKKPSGPAHPTRKGRKTGKKGR